MSVSPDTTVEISHRGDVSAAEIDSAVERVRAVADRCRERVDHIEVRLILEVDPARERPALAEATLDVDGHLVRAHVAAGKVTEAVDLLLDRLRRRIEDHEDRRHQIPQRHRTGDSGPGEWRHGDLPANRPEYLELSFEDREVTRHKTFAMEPMPLEEAVFDLDRLGHDFYLFVDESTRADSVVRRSDLGIELLCTDPNGLVVDGVAGVTTNASPPPVLGLPDAKEHLEASGDRSLFFVSDESRRGHVLYRRFDGHYGLITPAGT